MDVGDFVEEAVVVVEDSEEEAVSAVMKKVDKRHLRKISRMLSEVDVSVLEERDTVAKTEEEEVAVRKVLHSVETRNVRKISHSLRGVDVSRVLRHFRDLHQDKLGQKVSGRSPPVSLAREDRPRAALSQRLPLHMEEEESGEETDPLSSSESSSGGSERSLNISSLVYTSNNNIMDINQNSVDSLDSPSKNNHEFVHFAESPDLLTVLRTFADLRQNLNIAENLKTFRQVFPALQQKLANRIPHR